MREIKFRAWDRVNELMSKATSLTYNNMNQQLTILNKKGHFSCLFCDVVLMQYTGLKDKNGIEVYEGDIVVYDDTPYNVHTSILTGVIKMENLSFKLISIKPDSLGYRKMLIGSDDFFNRKSKVIGNIYENPELLM